jgi:hypothetical protein
MIMKLKAAWKYAIFGVGILLIPILIFSVSTFNARPACFVSQGQTVVKWKDEYWPCNQWWNIRCLWPIHRKHTTYKITIKQGVPMREANGTPIVVAGGKIRTWEVYDSTAWNGLENYPGLKNTYQNYEPVAKNEYVVMVETRYRLFHNVEATLRICTQKP